MSKSRWTIRYGARDTESGGFTVQSRGRTRRIHCPDPGTETPMQGKLGLTGCGSFNVSPVEAESVNDKREVDCHECGLWFTLEEEYPTR